MFKVTQSKGFTIRFANGYCLSVQFGGSCYCSNKLDIDSMNDALKSGKRFNEIDRELAEKGSATAEIAVLDPDNHFCGQQLGIFNGDDVEGWCSPERVLEVLNKVAAINVATND